MYSVKVNGEWYGCGGQRPQFDKGQTVSFMWEQKGNFKNVIKNTMELKSDAPAAAPAAAPTQSKGKDDYWGKKDKYDKEVRQKIIMYQSATKDAVTLAVAALENGCLPTPGTKKADKYEAFRSMVDRIRDEIYLSYEMANKSLEEGKSPIEGYLKQLKQDEGSAPVPISAPQQQDEVPQFSDPDMPF